jgi:hypothetical protein
MSQEWVTSGEVNGEQFNKGHGKVLKHSVNVNAEVYR